MSDEGVDDGRVIGGTGRRRPSRVGVSICVLVAMVTAACGGRADKNKDAAAWPGLGAADFGLPDGVAVEAPVVVPAAGSAAGASVAGAAA